MKKKGKHSIAVNAQAVFFVVEFSLISKKIKKKVKKHLTNADSMLYLSMIFYFTVLLRFV
jgi:hypothetical protein